MMIVLREEEVWRRETEKLLYNRNGPSSSIYTQSPVAILFSRHLDTERVCIIGRRLFFFLGCGFVSILLMLRQTRKWCICCILNVFSRSSLCIANRPRDLHCIKTGSRSLEGVDSATKIKCNKKRSDSTAAAETLVTILRLLFFLLFPNVKVVHSCSIDLACRLQLKRKADEMHSNIKLFHFFFKF